MTELLTAAQMRAIEMAAIEAGEVTGLELMERAGRGVVEAVFEEWPELAATSHRAVVLCGPGNNGGDGFVVARLLKEWGWEVEVFLYGDPEKLPPDARVNYERWVSKERIWTLGQVDSEFDTVYWGNFTNLFVDAMFGTGLSRVLDESADRIVELIIPDGDLVPDRHAYPKTVAIDVPSGLCADSGKPMPVAIWADLTVTFHREKSGHRIWDGADYCS